MDRMTSAKKELQEDILCTYDLGNGERIRIYPNRLGANAYAVLRNERFEEEEGGLSFTDGRHYMKVDKQRLSVQVTEMDGGGFTSIEFRPCYLKFEGMELGLRAVMRLFPALCRTHVV